MLCDNEAPGAFCGGGADDDLDCVGCCCRRGSCRGFMIVDCPIAAMLLRRNQACQQLMNLRYTNKPEEKSRKKPLFQSIDLG